MSKRIYVGNVPYTVSEQELRDHFGQAGPVERVSIITDRETGRPRGFVFVEMDDAGAARAVAELNGSMLGGRTLVVNEAKDRDRPRHQHRDREDRRGTGRDRDW